MEIYNLPILLLGRGVSATQRGLHSSKTVYPQVLMIGHSWYWCLVSWGFSEAALNLRVVVGSHPSHSTSVAVAFGGQSHPLGKSVLIRWNPSTLDLARQYQHVRPMRLLLSVAFHLNSALRMTGLPVSFFKPFRCCNSGLSCVCFPAGVFVACASCNMARQRKAVGRLAHLFGLGLVMWFRSCVFR